MGIMTRMLRLCKADVHGVMDQLEDKGLLLKQYLQGNGGQASRSKERQIHGMTRNADRLQRQVLRHGEEMEKLEADLNLALAKEKDDIARMLIRRRRSSGNRLSMLKGPARNDRTQEKSALAATLEDQRLQYETLKARADAYCRQTNQRSVGRGKRCSDWRMESHRPQGGRNRTGASPTQGSPSERRPPMKSPIRTTLVYGLICALIAMPAAGSIAGIVGGSIAFKLVLWTILSGYSLLLARWSGKHPAVLLFPLILLLGTAVWPGIDSVFFFLGLGVLCWLRSGICFSGFPLRAMIALKLLPPPAARHWSPCWDRATP